MASVSTRREQTTIADVATAAGVSRATVSRVMNGRSTVDPEISERVRRVAAELSYRPSNVARSLSIGRTHTVALVVPDLGNPVFQQILRGVTTAAAPAGYRVLVADSAEDPTEEAAIALEARLRCDALVLVSPRMPDAQLAALAPEVAPVVLVNRALADDSVPALVVDYAHAAEQVLEHLVGLDHVRVVYLSGPAGSTSDARRREGLERVLARHPEVELVDVPAGSDIAAGHAAVDEVLAARATAVVAFNDLVAFGLLAGLNEAGVAVPADLSVAGFDDIDLARYATPSLTTVSVPQAELGRHAWKELSALIEAHEGASRATRFDPSLEVRASTGPAPRGVVPARAQVREPGPAAGAPGAGSPAAGRRVRWEADGDAVALRHGDVRLARYQQGDRLPQVHAPRAYLHPVHTLAGVPLTDAGPVDHRHHYGASVAVPDVNGTSYWGGRTFVADVGPTLLPNHGRQASRSLLVDPVEPHLLHDHVRWYDEHGVPQLEEDRRLGARVLDDETWVLDWSSTLRAERGALVIGSPATNGRPGAGYGGLFWRLPAVAGTTVLGADGVGEERAHGGTSPWLALVQEHAGHPTTLLLVQPGDPLPWFVRAAEYPGAGPALAWDSPRTVPAGGTFETGVRAVLVDRALDLDAAAALAERVR